MDKKLIYDILYGLLIIFMIMFVFKKISSNIIQNYLNNDKYEFLPNNKNIVIKNISDPIIEMKKYNVIFAGTIKNVEEFIKKNLDNIDTCGKKFNDYFVIIYENDSTDNTRNILLENKKSNYEYIFENNITEPRRTMRIANGRNKILNRIRELNINQYYNYLIMLDLDDVNISGNFVNTINTCFEYSNWDVLTGNQHEQYYDLWALRKKNDMEYDCWRMVQQNSNIPNSQYIFVYSKYKKYDPGQLLEVDSAFSGIAIYKLSSIPNECNYVGQYDDGGELCEHVEFNRCIKNSGKNIYINSSFFTNLNS
jgi:hypothetical protein